MKKLITTITIILMTLVLSCGSAETADPKTKTITKEVVEEKEVEVEVEKPLTTAETATLVAATLDLGAITFGTNDGTISVTQNFVVPVSDATYGTTTVWSCDKDAISIDAQGNATVTRAAYVEGATNVKCTATVSKDSDTATKEYNFTVESLPEVIVPVSAMDIVKSSTEIFRYANETLSTNITPANATNQNINWTSTDTNIVTVDNSGTITAIAVGSASVIASSLDGAFMDVCDVNVNPVMATGVTIGGYDTLIPLGDLQLTAELIPATTENRAATWTIADEAVATIDTNTGLVTGVAEGTTIVTVTSDDGGFQNTLSIEVIESVRRGAIIQVSYGHLIMITTCPVSGTWTNYNPATDACDYTDDFLLTSAYTDTMCDDLVLDGYSDWRIPNQDEIVVPSFPLGSQTNYPEYWFWDLDANNETWIWSSKAHGGEGHEIVRGNDRNNIVGWNDTNDTKASTKCVRDL